MQITQQLIRRLKPVEKPYEIRDDKLKGFILRVQPTGAMSYICEYERGRRVTLGKANLLTLTQARNKALEILGKAAGGEDPRKKKKPAATLREFLGDYYRDWALADMRTGKKRIQEIESHFGEFLNKSLGEITPWLIEKWRLQERKAGKKPATIHRNETTLKAALSKAVQWGVIEQHPLDALKPISADDNAVIRFLSGGEEQALFKAMDERERKIRGGRERGNAWREDRGYEMLPETPPGGFADHLKPAVLISLHTGLRAGELLSLTWRNVNFHTKTLTVSGENAKSRKIRHIPLNAVALDALARWKKQSAGEYVFPGKAEGRCYNIPKKPWAAVLEAAGVQNFRWHDLRHTFASKLVMAGVDLNTVRELLGHSDIKMTLRYAHLAPEHKAAAVAALVSK